METTNKQVKKQDKVTISFKPNEMWIYYKICEHSAKGNWIKDVLTEYLKGSGYDNRGSSTDVKPTPTIGTNELDNILGIR